MNKLQAYAIKDIQSQLFTNPHFMTNETIALRAFEGACRNPETNFHKYPQDFSLYHVGDYDIVTAKMEAITPKQVANATQYTEQLASPENISKMTSEAIKTLEQ